MAFVRNARKARRTAHRPETTFCPGASSLKGLLFVLLVVAFLLASRQAAAMFVSPPDKEDSPAKAGEDRGVRQSAATEPSEGPAGERPPSLSQSQPTASQLSRPVTADSQEDLRLRDHLRSIYVDPFPKRAVNSRSFERMSGKNNVFGSVVVPVSKAPTRGAASAPPKEPPPDPQQRIFSIGSWLFILVCVAAAGIALLRIRRLTGSN